MGIIVELSQLVANQIAAGEVVERPASVVKELLENSLDAGSKHIEVRIKNGGFDYIVVQDDGAGMDEADLQLCLKRYATSKLSAVSDLDRLHTFGFRGEALPSIAAVSELTITSRPKHQEYGNKVSARAGIIDDFTKAGASFGTRIAVHDLFYNVPARLKFARTKRAETAEIERLIRSLAFCHKEISWSFFVDDKLVFSTKDGTSQSRALLLLGQEAQGYIYDVFLKTDVLTISGVIGAPAISRRDGRGMILFVNNRLVTDKKLIMAVKTAFRTVLEVGYQPVCALNIEVAPDAVDVNIHPRKAEVRFCDERRVLAHIINSIGEFLSTTPWLAQQHSQTNPHAETTRIGGFESLAHFDQWQPRKNYFPQTFGFVQKSYDPVSKPLLISKKFSDVRIVGQVMATYLIGECEDGLVVIDQHAAHERIMYEKIKKQRQNIESIPLLIPFSINISNAEMALFMEHKDNFFNMGIEAEALGDESIVIRALPDYLKNADIHLFIKDMFADLESYGKTYAEGALFEHVCATLACHASVRAGQRLNKEQIEALLIELDDTDFRAHCPHGRPIVKSFNTNEVKTWFDRT